VSNAYVKKRKHGLKRYFQPRLLWPRPIRTKLGRSAAPLAILILLVLIAGASFGTLSLTKKHSTASKFVLTAAIVKPFEVVSTLPASGEKDVQDGSKVTINFSQPVNASKLENAFIVSPTIKGSVAQGTNSKQIIFTPTIPFSNSTSVSIMIDNSFQSQLGQKLKSDYLLGFTTQIPADGVDFVSDNTYDNLVSQQSNTNVAFTLEVGPQVDSGGTIQIYKASLDPLLASLEYQRITDSGYTYDSPSAASIDTSGMQLVSTSTGLKDQAVFNFKQANGIYLVAAISQGKQVGWTWVVYNDNGTLMRQDDQKIVLSAYNLSDNSIPSDADVAFYNLQDGVQQLESTTLHSPETYNFGYSQRVDVAVVTIGTDTMVLPIAVPDSLADARVKQDLSATRTFYAVTDKPTYQVNDTAKIAGYVNIDQDAQYAADPDSSLQFYVAQQSDPNTILDTFSVPVSSSGVFSGQFGISAALKGMTDLAVYAYQDTSNQTPTIISTFAVASTTHQYVLHVSFPKSDYMANDTVNATISATGATGQALANASVSYNVYTKPYYENDLKDNLDSFGTTGTLVGNILGRIVQLNSSGQAVISIPVSQLPTGYSQSVTVQASMTDSNGSEVDGGTSTIIHQGNIVLKFGTGKSYFAADDSRVARVYATDLNGKPLANTAVSYHFVEDSYDQTSQQEVTNIIGSGSGTTDNNGYLEISQQLSTEDSVEIVASATDSGGNTVVATDYTNTTSTADSTPVMAGADNLDYLDVSGSNGLATVGDQMHLTITSPQNLSVLVSLERGRIYKYETVQLTKGTNSYTIDVTPELAPSFNLVFSYFLNGTYHTEGTPFTVTNPAQQLNVAVSADKLSYNAGQTANLTIKTTNSDGNPAPANLIIGVESDSEFDLNSSFVPDMYSYYYASREYSTNSSSTLTGIGTGGGRCGGGGYSPPTLSNNSGTTLYWNPNVTTDASGNATISVPMQSGNYHVVVYAMGDNASVGNTDTSITAQ
jgi:hypothetical protein